MKVRKILNKASFMLALLFTLLIGCGKDDTPEIAETEKLLRKVVSEDNSMEFEYNADKTVRKISNEFIRLDAEYNEGHLSQIRFLTAEVNMSVRYSYGSDNKVTAFKHGDEPVTAVQYNAQTNTYSWTKEGIAYTAKLNAEGDMETYTTKEPGEDAEVYSFAYEAGKKGGFTNSTSILLQMYMLYGDIGYTLTYMAGMTYRPVDYFSANGGGVFYTNRYDRQGFVTQYGIAGYAVSFEY